MKHVVITALAATLLSGTSALAQDADSPVVRMARQMAERSQAQRPAPAERQAQRAAPTQRESRPQQAAPVQQRQERPSESSNNDRSRETAARPSRPQTPLAGGAQGQRPQNAWQGQRQPDRQATPAQRGTDGRQAQARPGAQSAPGQWQGRPDGQATPAPRGQQQTDRRPGGQYELERTNPPVVGVARNLAGRIEENNRRERYENRRDWNDDYRRNWEDNRGDYDRRPVIRPEDRYDRDRNRPRYDQRRYPHYITSQQRYRWRGAAYRAPVGFYSFRWQWGQTLPWNWYTPNYYLNDYWAYGLPMPPIGCEWVRAGDDAILVDVFTGRVYQVVYNLFW